MKTTDAQTFVPKGWGHERWITNTEKYCGKELLLLKGRKLSWHYHLVKDEVFYVLSGRVNLRYGHEDSLDNCSQLVLIPGDSFHVQPGLRHQLEGLEDSMVIEFSTYHDEADSIRVIKGD